MQEQWIKALEKIESEAPEAAEKVKNGPHSPGMTPSDGEEVRSKRQHKEV
jgi:hypothetical protein